MGENVKYRRNKKKGGTFFITVVLADRNALLLIEEIHLLRQSFRRVKRGHPFYIDAIVILPDHFHMVMTLPEGDSDYSTRIRLIKSNFSRWLPRRESVTESRIRKSERGIWQRRFWEHTIRDEKDYIAVLNYIYINPVKHGLVDDPLRWPFSSFFRNK